MIKIILKVHLLTTLQITDMNKQLVQTDTITASNMDPEPSQLNVVMSAKYYLVDEKIDEAGNPWTLMQSFHSYFGTICIVVTPEHSLHHHEVTTFVSRPVLIVL